MTPGKITVTTVNNGDIITKDLFIGSGAGRTSIYVSASGDLTIKGDVSIGEPGQPLLGIPGGRQADAMIHLIANDNVVLDGDVVGAYADSTDNHSSETLIWAYIKILAGEDGTPNRDVTIRADLTARARASENSSTRRTTPKTSSSSSSTLASQTTPPSKRSTI